MYGCTTAMLSCYAPDFSRYATWVGAYSMGASSTDPSLDRVASETVYTAHGTSRLNINLTDVDTHRSPLPSGSAFHSPCHWPAFKLILPRERSLGARSLQPPLAPPLPPCVVVHRVGRCVSFHRYLPTTVCVCMSLILVHALLQIDLHSLRNRTQTQR